MTDAQTQAWPLISGGKHVLVVAPTGSGKTLTAFLGAIDSLVRGHWQGRGVKVLYVSPLKALNNDIRRNLLLPLAELRAFFREHAPDEPFPDITVQTRSGDTTTEERRRLVHNPPDILVTTPESLNIMLCSQGGRGMLGGVRVVILDEIHALASSKRGTHLIAAVESLTLLSGEFQRIGLSATVTPPKAVADWMGGYLRTPSGDWRPRPVEVVESRDRRAIQLDLVCVKPPDLAAVPAAAPPGGDAGQSKEIWWEALADRLVGTIRAHRSTLVFANSRRLTEKLTRFINDRAGELLAYSHHGSLSKELRLDVEQRLKDGELKAIVATSSLELGIDIGSIDKVVLVESPFAISSALQRIGRASHQVGATSHAELIPLHGLDLVYGLVTADLVRRRQIETSVPVANPLDLLAQLILAQTSAMEWKLDDLYDFFRTMHPYHGLQRHFFDLTIDMLAGRYAELPIRELKPRLELDVLAGTARARPGSEFLLYQSGGTIPDRGYFQLRHAVDKALLGELDEEFVWERNLGDQFTLGTAAWKIAAITQNAVEVLPADPARLMVPFWKAEDQNRDFHSAQAVGEFLETVDGRLDDPDLPGWLESAYGLDAAGSENLVRFLLQQRSLSGTPLPSRHHLLVEEIGLGADARDRHAPVLTQVIIHTFWGGRINKPFALALAAAWEQRYGAALEYFAGNESLMLQLPEGSEGEVDLIGQIRGLVDSRNLESLLRGRLEGSGLFGARFRENAARALLLPRGDARRRIPLWLTRMRSRKLLDAVSSGNDFPIVVETWRECLEDEFDLENLKLLLDELASGAISISHRSGREPSPFAAGMIWRQTNRDMYNDDTPAPGGTPTLSADIFRTLLGDARLRPPVPAELATKFTAKLQGTWPDYRPESPGELVGVLNELGFMAATLWDELCHYSSFSVSADPTFQDDLARLSRLFARFRPPGAQVDWIVAVPQLPGILRGLDLDPADPPADLPQEVRRWLMEQEVPAVSADETGANAHADHRAGLLLRWLERQGPVSLSRIEWMFGWPDELIITIVEGLCTEERVVTGALIEGNEGLRVCESENYERLLRLHRTARRQGFETIPLAELPLFLAEWHGLVAPTPEPGIKTLQEVLDRCMGYPLPAALWEQVVLPTRLRPYQPAWLDSLGSQYGICWLGSGEGRLLLAFQDDAPLYIPDPVATEDGLDDGQRRFLEILRASEGSLNLLEIARAAGLDSRQAGAMLWQLAWKALVTGDSFEVVRQGIRSEFKGDALPSGRGVRRRWESIKPQGGGWQAVRHQVVSVDAIDRLETVRERANQLLRRYGVVFRELLAAETQPMQWAQVQRTFRLMELSGEVLAGRFFEGVPGIQFALPEAVRRLQDRSQGVGDGSGAVWWINAQDPVSLCGLGLDFTPVPSRQLESATAAPGLGLPRRVAGTWLVYLAQRLVMVVRRQGREVDLALEPGDGNIGRVLGFFPFLLGRSLEVAPAVMVEKINDEPVAGSPWAADFRKAGFIADHNGLTLWRRF